MTNINIWTILGVITIALLIIFWRKRNAVWGGLTISVIISLVIAIVYLFKGNGFNWSIIGKGTVLGTIAGFVAELLGMISDFIRKKKQ
ncbi:MAG: Uncharacterized protein CEN91_50 [Candidatus Berkelbacteria bacterium Licking1014_85]|uniref:Uncharacterized protein n=1 Tax=Candidatus Berkelbacteria bacterium Licking1014_85 TaxID=2017148 RepID=A0A554LME8_9BACT|nr:MAG: Uncharacterized protein CEN91_50 [Candidatus Berkelbacteria bacterium Licking1014_85]